MKSTDFERSAPMLTGGVVAMVVGTIMGFLAALDSAQGTNAGGDTGIVVVAALLSLVGLCVVAGGVWRLATNVDLAAKVAAGILARAESAAMPAEGAEQ